MDAQEDRRLERRWGLVLAPAIWLAHLLTTRVLMAIECTSPAYAVARVAVGLHSAVSLFAVIAVALQPRPGSDREGLETRWSPTPAVLSGLGAAGIVGVALAALVPFSCR